MFLPDTQIKSPHAFSHHESPEEVPKSKGQALFIDSGPSSGRQAVRIQSLSTSFPLKNQDKTALSAAYEYQGKTSKRGEMKHPGSTDQKRRTRPRKSRIFPLSPLKMGCLNRAYADVIANAMEESAARLLAAERKPLWFQRRGLGHHDPDLGLHGGNGNKCPPVFCYSFVGV
ncbi:hypothetical protein AXF42_Ash002845 [Apostasia shenzhenica]|uniref:Uncharacterized protein n=1 Tax=Apostasia shenzhenica TaxID=1088818 RepID=A0A2I0A7F9_9ASPA|nr:hypothetical protein AXF42_Ash002845 [Apostasia shenzhenica]